jgi:hypothetical protein
MYDLSRPVNIPYDERTDGYCGRDAGKRGWFGKEWGWIGWNVTALGTGFQLLLLLLLLLVFYLWGLISILCGALKARQECEERASIVIVIVITVIIVVKSFFLARQSEKGFSSS